VRRHRLLGLPACDDEEEESEEEESLLEDLFEVLFDELLDELLDDGFIALVGRDLRRFCSLFRA
jgi:hypothetical protein